MLRLQRAGLGLLGAVTLLAAAGRAEDKPAADKAPEKPGERAAEKSDKPVERAFLPADVTVQQKSTAAGRALAYSVTAGSLPMTNDKGERKADMFYVAYAVAGAAPTARPITFAFNGGPGASSAFLQFGAIGPKRLPFGNNGDAVSAAPALVDNPDSWLDFTDLVFVDPIGTGYSRTIATGDDAAKPYWSVTGDIESLSSFIMQYLVKAGRLTSPKYLVGESYGGFRGPRIAHHLATREGVGLAGLILVSPALDFTFLGEGGYDPLPLMARLPSYAAAALGNKGPVEDTALEAVEHYAATDYLVDFARGAGDAASLERIDGKLAALTGLDPALVKRLRGQIGNDAFARERLRDSGELTSQYDATVRGFDAFPESYGLSPEAEDPILAGVIAPVTSAAVDYIQRTIGYHADGRYELLNLELNRKWEYKTDGPPIPPESVTDLRRILALNAQLKVLVAHGLTDVVCPYFASKYILAHIPSYGEASRVTLKTFPGGHMFYTRDGARAALRSAARALYPQAAG